MLQLTHHAGDPTSAPGTLFRGCRGICVQRPLGRVDSGEWAQGERPSVVGASAGYDVTQGS